MLNQIGSVRDLDGAAARSSIAMRDNRGTGSFILIDPATNFTAGAGMIASAVGEDAARGHAATHCAERIARAARGAGSEAEAIAAVRQALEELLM